MTYTTEITENVLRLSLSGDLTGAYDMQHLLSEVDTIIGQGVMLCVVDISHVRYFSSTGINLLTTLLARFRTRGGELVLTRPSDQVKKLLIVTKLTSIFSIVEDQAEGITRLKSEPEEE
jgi:anti-sigma B factor antagonist